MSRNLGGLERRMGRFCRLDRLEPAGDATGTGPLTSKAGKNRDAWLQRLEEADREGKLRGYSEPEDPTERSVTRKRFLVRARASRTKKSNG